MVSEPETEDGQPLSVVGGHFGVLLCLSKKLKLRDSETGVEVDSLAIYIVRQERGYTLVNCRPRTR